MSAKLNGSEVVLDEHGERVSKTAVLQYVRRIRENLREIEQALKDDDWDYVREGGLDTSGAGGEIEHIADVFIAFMAARS